MGIPRRPTGLREPPRTTQGKKEYWSASLVDLRNAPQSLDWSFDSSAKSTVPYSREGTHQRAAVDTCQSMSFRLSPRRRPENPESSPLSPISTPSSLDTFHRACPSTDSITWFTMASVTCGPIGRLNTCAASFSATAVCCGITLVCSNAFCR